ncbi:MAG: M23 family metallopeptidase, partial [Spirochaetaceae bacterium]
MAKIFSNIIKHRKVILPVIYLVLLLGGILFFNLVVVDYIEGFMVSVNNVELGIVKSRGDIMARLSVLERQIEHEKNIDIVFDEHLISYNPLETTLDKLAPQERLDSNLRDHLTYKCRVWALVVSGKETVYCRTREEVENLVKQLEQKFTPRELGGEKIEDLQLTILEQYTIEPALSYFDAIRKDESALEYALAGMQDVRTYTVLSGDNFFSIAMAHGIDFQTVVAANEEIQPDKLKPGDRIKLTVTNPVLSIQSTYRLIKDENIPPPVIVKMDGTLLRTQQIEEVAGEMGKKRVYSDRVVVNDKVIEVNIIREEILKAPRVRVLRFGTQRTPDDILVAGAFLPPGIGIISSPFGIVRWNGKVHSGIDVAVGEGTSVLAYDAGTIKLTAYDGGGYGNYVIILHDNGVET